MPNPIYRLVYYSRNHVDAESAVFVAEIDDILAKSRVNNMRDGITGALLFNGGCFGQVLEGPLDRLEAAFERIQQDERHGEVSLLTLEPIATRSFPHWAMGFVGLSQDHASRFADVAAASGFDIALLNGDQLHMILRDLAIDEEKAVA